MPDRSLLLLLGVVLLSSLIVGWTVAIFWFDSIPFAILHPVAHGAIEAARSLALLFGAVALFLFPHTGMAERMRWIALALVILAIGGIGFAILFTVFSDQYGTNERLYASISIRTIASVLLAIGLIPAPAPRLTAARTSLVIAGFIGISALILLTADHQPDLTEPTGTGPFQAPQEVHLDELTALHWILSGFSLSVIAVILIRLLRPANIPDSSPWLVIGMVLLAGSHLHNLFWPSIYTPVATSADVLRIGFAVSVVVGVIVELRNVAIERTIRLAEEQEYSERLRELQVLRADFTQMVAHELSNPLAAIQHYAEILKFHQITSDQREHVARDIQHETDLLRTLVADVYTTAAVERDDFSINLQAVSLETILDDATSYARSFPELELKTRGNSSIEVRADRDRIGQVMRNLINNAVKHTPEGTPVEIHCTCDPETVRIAVRDYGPGIHPNDHTRIFEKFGRGTSTRGKETGGLGLGLYVSRRILRLHGSELQIESTDGPGTTFSFGLRRAFSESG